MEQKVESPPLAAYRSISNYEPQYGDLIFRCGWFRSYYGIVNNYDKANAIVSVVMEGTPQLLLTLLPDEIQASELLFNLRDIRGKRKGSWSAIQLENGQQVWYI